MAQLFTPDFPTPKLYPEGNPIRYFFGKFYKPPIIISTFVCILVLNLFIPIWQGILVADYETQSWYLVLELVLSILIAFELSLRIFVLNAKFCKKASNILDFIFTMVSLLITVSGFAVTLDSIQVLAGWCLLLLRNVYLTIVLFYFKIHKRKRKSINKWFMEEIPPPEVMNEAFVKKKNSLPTLYKPKLSNIHEVDEKFEATDSIANSYRR